MVKKEKLSKIIIILVSCIIIIIAFAILFSGKAIYRTQDIVLNQETGEIDYVITSEYVTNNAFVPNKKILIKLDIESINADSFQEIKGGIVFFGDGMNFIREGLTLLVWQKTQNSKDTGDVYSYPLNITNNLIKNPEFNTNQMTLSSDYKKIHVELPIQFSRPGEYPNNIVLYSDNNEIYLNSNKNILIEPYSNLVQVRSLKWTLIALIFSIFGISINLYLSFKEDRKNNKEESEKRSLIKSSLHPKESSENEKGKIIEKKTTSRNFVIALSVVSIIGFLSIILESLFFVSIAGYIDTLWLIVLGLGLILETSIKEMKSVKKKGLTPEYLGKITMLIVGGISIIAGILSLPQINIQNPSFLAVKGIISILAIIFIILQTWLSERN